MPASAPLLRMERVSKRFGSGWAIRDIALGVEPGEVLALLGPSGCGKSTILRLIAGLIAPSDGQILRQGAWGRGDLGYVFQDATLMPWATVAENVHLPLGLLGRGRAEADPAIEEILALVGLSEVAGSYPRELSGGMRMRVSIARALITRPRLVLMDEPFAALDEITRFRLNDELLQLQARTGCTVIFVTHSVAESVYLADRIAVLTPQPGKVAELVTIDEGTPRGEGFRNSDRFAGHCRRVSAILRSVMEVA